VSAINPQAWQDQEDGRAIRELRGAWANGYIGIDLEEDRFMVWVGNEDPTDEALGFGDTLAQAADACRDMLAKR
jgi:hypothetical protein